MCRKRDLEPEALAFHKMVSDERGSHHITPLQRSRISTDTETRTSTVSPAPDCRPKLCPSALNSPHALRSRANTRAVPRTWMTVLPMPIDPAKQISSKRNGQCFGNV